MLDDMSTTTEGATPMNTTTVPLRELAEEQLCPGAAALEEINTLHR